MQAEAMDRKRPGLRLLASSLVALAIMLLAGAVSMSALGRTGGSTRAFEVLRGAGRGVVYRHDRRGLQAARRQAAVSCSVSCAGPLVYHGGAVLHAHTTYTIYWAPSNPNANGQPGTSFTPFPGGYESTVNGFLTNVAADGKSHAVSNVYSTDLQYGEPGSGVYDSTFGKAFKDEKAYPPRDTVSPQEDCPVSSNGGADHLPLSSEPCLTDAQLKAELQLFVTEQSLPTGLGALYFVLTPQGVSSCAGGAGGEAECNTNVYCAYHSQTFSVSPLIYANMPYDHVPGCETPGEPNGTPADDEINTLSHEHNEAVSDPTGEGWYYGKLVEVGDKCTYPFFNPAEDSNEITDAYGPLLEGSSGTTAFNQIINGGHYLLQREWSNAAGGCVTQAPVPVASFAVYSSPATTGQAVSFNGTGSSPSAGVITSYHWELGDGQTADGAQVTHTYESTGKFTVHLTVTNDSGASASASQTVTIEAPRSGGGQTTTVTTTVTAPAPPPPAPLAFAANQLAGFVGLPRNGAKLSGLGAIALGHAECPPACSIAFKLYATVRTTGRQRRTLKRVLIGALTTTIAAKGTGALTLTLNAGGRKLLAKSHTLSSQLTVTVVGQEGGSWQIARTLTLTSAGKTAKRRASRR
ncbi:MAG TPA: PKD domain-containing protein [Solirubrobacteraceae bacterium]|nr:PKD domain-containing protein [Solirubrobacteraceae bacterium]